MRRRIILLPAIAVLIGAICYVGWNSLSAHSTSKVAHNQTVATKIPLVTPAPKKTITPLPATHAPAPVVAPQPAAAAASAVAKPIVGNSLTIPSIGVNAPLVDVGVTKTNNIGAPAKNAQVGRWTGGGWPGGLGSVVFLNGHVQGVFSNLKKLKVGQTVSVNYNNTVFNYRVVHTETVPLKNIDMSKPLSIYGGGQEGLNMMTCAGSYNLFTGTYTQRLTVYTVRIP